MKFAEKNTRSQSNNATHSANGKIPPFFQPRLNFGKPGDAYEVEADKMADRIVEKNNVDKTTFFAPSVHSQVSKVPAAALSAVQNNTELLTNEEPYRLQLLADDEFEEVVQPKADNPQIPSSGFETQLTGSKGIGSELPAGVKSEMETGFGADFSNVRIHTGNDAVQMSRQIGAQAFTHGNDIFFNEGKFDPSSKTGRHLLAHELTHTIQQGASVQEKMVQKVDYVNTGNDTSLTVGSSTPNVEPEFIGTFIDTSSSKKELKIPKVHLPTVKQRNSDKYGSYEYYQNGVILKVRPGARSRTDQVDNWKSDVRPHIQQPVHDKVIDAGNSGGFSEGNYFFRLNTNNNLLVFGTEDELKERMLIPFWNKAGSPMTFQVDHVVEDQLEGVDAPKNYELLEASANMSAGSSLGNEIRTKISGAINALNAEKEHRNNQGNPVSFDIPSATNARRNYLVTFNEAVYDLDISGHKSDDDYWSLSDIKGQEGQTPAHINMLQPLTGNELQESGNIQEPRIFFSESGGVAQQLPDQNTLPVNQWLPRVNLVNYSLNDNPAPGQAAGILQIEAFKASQMSGTSVIENSKPTPDDWQLKKITPFYGGAIITDSVKSNIRNSLRLPGMSPIVIDELRISEAGLYGRGRVLPTLTLLDGLEIDILIEGAEIQLRKTFVANDLHFPSPFEIEECDLTVFLSNQAGLGIEGRIEFGIRNVGQGHIGASASTAGGFALEGAFNFDSDLFDPAQINVEYHDNIWTIGGTIGIPEGKVRGVKSAQITASYSENSFTASGEAELDIPGIERGRMEVRYWEEGFSIAGNFDLSSDIPGIRSGNVEARISKENSSEGYNVFVSGTANPDIPGINSTLAVTYDNGALTIEGSADYRRGMLSGRIDVGATNRAIGDDGQPTGEPDRTMRVYGGGSLTLQLTPWLAATAGVRFLPNGEMVVTARLSTDTYTVFARREYNRSLFRVPTIEIPIFAIPLGPRSIGLVAQIGGGLDFNAGFGPGQLRNLSAEITYNPDHEDETAVRGHGEFVIPANAALVLRGDLSLGVSIAIASLTGGIELAGSLGLEGEAAAEVDVNWSPAEGLALDAQGSIMVNPKFAFDVNAFARASLGIGWFSISETWRYNIVSFQWGPNIRFGIIFPIHYREGEPFDMSFDDIELIYPELDVVEMSVGLARSIKDRIFD